MPMESHIGEREVEIIRSLTSGKWHRNKSLVSFGFS